MAKIDRNKGHYETEHWTMMKRATMQTPAFKALSTTAKALYPFLKLEWKGPKYNNNGKIRFSCRQAAEALGVSKDTAAKALRDLQAKGFIVVTKLGALGVDGMAKGPTYEITEIEMPTSEKRGGRSLFKEWRTGADFSVASHGGNGHGKRRKIKAPSE